MFCLSGVRILGALNTVSTSYLHSMTVGSGPKSTRKMSPYFLRRVWEEGKKTKAQTEIVNVIKRIGN